MKSTVSDLRSLLDLQPCGWASIVSIKLDPLTVREWRPHGGPDGVVLRSALSDW